MSVIFSRSCEYGIQSVLYLASTRSTEAVLLREMSAALDIPHHFLSKVLQLLVRHRIVKSRKGLHGGFVLGRPADAITLADIVQAIDGEDFSTACVLGFPECDSKYPCPVHNTWKTTKASIATMLSGQTVADMGRAFETKIHTSRGRKNKRRT